MNQANRIIVNTIAQYTRTFLGILLALYSTRVVLMELGSSDFGLFSLVGSVLAFLSFFNTAITRSTQRFLSYHLGKSDWAYQSVVLFNSLLLNVLISLVTAVVMFLLEPLLFSGFLNIDESQIGVAKTLYRIMILSVFFTMNMSTFSAVFVSHENIVFTSVVYIVGAILKLVAALVLPLFSDKLLVYGLLICGISLVELIIYVVFSALFYAEVRSVFNRTYIDKQLVKSLLSFSGWNLYGTLTIAGINQGYAIVVNKFISLGANAGLGVASQVSGQVNNLVYSVSNAMSPVITREEGAGDRDKMIRFTMSASRISAIIYSLIAIPIIFEIDFVLRIWLGTPPMYASAFVVSFLLASLMDSYSEGFRTGVQAIGKLRDFTLIFYTVKLLSIPISIVLLKMGMNPNLTLLPYIVVQLLGSFISIFFFSKYTETPFVYYIKEIIIKLVPSLVISSLECLIIILFIKNQALQLMAIALIPTITTLALSYIIVLTPREREIVLEMYGKLSRRIRSKKQ